MSEEKYIKCFDELYNNAVSRKNDKAFIDFLSSKSNFDDYVTSLTDKTVQERDPKEDPDYLTKYKKIGYESLKLVLNNNADENLWIGNALKILRQTILELDYVIDVDSNDTKQKNQFNVQLCKIDDLEKIAEKLLDNEEANDDIKEAAAHILTIILCLPRENTPGSSKEKSNELLDYLNKKLNILDQGRSPEDDPSKTVKAIFDGVILFFSALSNYGRYLIAGKQDNNRKTKTKGILEKDDSRWKSVREKLWKRRATLDELINVNQRFEKLSSKYDENYKVSNDLPLTITIHSFRGGTGKTTIACALASHFLEIEKKKVLVIDFDLLNPSWFFLIGWDLEDKYQKILDRPDFATALVKNYFEPNDIKNYVISESDTKDSDLKNQEFLFVLGDVSPGIKANAYQRLNSIEGFSNFNNRLGIFLEYAKKDLERDVVIIDDSPSFYGSSMAMLDFSLHNKNCLPLFVSTYDYHDLAASVMDFDLLRESIKNDHSLAYWIINKIPLGFREKATPLYIASALSNHPGLKLYSPQIREVGARFFMFFKENMRIEYSQDLAQIWAINSVGPFRIMSYAKKLKENVTDQLTKLLNDCKQILNPQKKDLNK